jgi:hypothetical protein
VYIKKRSRKHFKSHKNYIALFAIVLVLFAAISIKLKYDRAKYSDINYVVTKRVTSGIFNSYKIYTPKDFNLAFSDGNVAIVNVSGIQKKSPHRSVTYKLYLEKDKNGIWRVKRFYPSL